MMILNELTRTEIIWLALGQLGLLLTMIGGVWIGISNHDDDKPALPFITMWFVYAISVLAAFLFTHYFKATSPPHVPWEANAFRLVNGMSFVAYPASRQFGLKRSMSHRLELIFSGLVGIVGVVAIGFAAYYGYGQYQAGPPSQEAYIARQAQTNGNLIKEGTALLSNQVDSLTQLTSLQAGQIVGLREEMGELSGRLTTTNALLARVSRKMDVQGVMLTRLLGKPSLPVEQTGKPAKAEATLSPYRVH